MIKAIFLDFYGTVVHEDGEIIKKITNIIYETGTADNTSQIDSFWWLEFQALFNKSYGNFFETQRELELKSLENTINHFNSNANGVELCNMMFEHWMYPPIFAEAKEFFKTCPVPIYIVSNIDRADVLKAIEYHDLNPAYIFTSEDAKSYKPRKEIFELALNYTGLKPNEVLHIGDSLSSDVNGATALGINALWLNRVNKKVPDGVNSVSNLLEVLDVEMEK